MLPAWSISGDAPGPDLLGREHWSDVGRRDVLPVGQLEELLCTLLRQAQDAADCRGAPVTRSLHPPCHDCPELQGRPLTCLAEVCLHLCGLLVAVHRVGYVADRLVGALDTSAQASPNVLHLAIVLAGVQANLSKES